MSEWTSALQSEVFRPLITWVVPGVIALAPYRLAFADELLQAGIPFPSETVAQFAVVLVTAAFLGLWFDCFGSFVEAGWGKDKDNEHDREWFKYLRQKFDVEPVGHRYLRQMVLRLKLELNTYVALTAAMPGIAMLLLRYANPSHVMPLLACVVLIAVMCRQFSKTTHSALSELRHEMLSEDNCSDREAEQLAALAPWWQGIPATKLSLMLVALCVLAIALAFVEVGHADLLVFLYGNSFFAWLIDGSYPVRPYAVVGLAWIAWLIARDTKLRKHLLTASKPLFAALRRARKRKQLRSAGTPADRAS